MLFQSSIGKGGTFTKKNDKYLKISEPGVYRIRLIGPEHSFLFHWEPSGRQICAKTLELKYGDTTAPDGTIIRGDFIYKQKDSAGNLIPFSPEQCYCYKCEKEESRRRLVQNVLDQNENDLLAAQGQMPNVRVMEFPYIVYQYFDQFEQETGVNPSDPIYGPVFEIKVYYPKKPGNIKPEPREIQYEVSWNSARDPQGNYLRDQSNNLIPVAPFTKEMQELLFAGVGNGGRPLVYDLVSEYNPLLNKRSVLNPDKGAAAPKKVFGTGAKAYNAPQQNVAMTPHPAPSPVTFQQPVAPVMAAPQPMMQQPQQQYVPQQQVQPPQQMPQYQPTAPPVIQPQIQAHIVPQIQIPTPPPMYQQQAQVQQQVQPQVMQQQPQQPQQPQAMGVPSVDDMLATLQENV